MKKIISVSVILIIIPFFSCKKGKTPAPGTGTTTVKNTPNLITAGYQPGVPVSVSQFNIFDLNHDDNKDKKYFRVEIWPDDSARIITEPKPIDSLAGNWPAAVKKVRWGSGAEFIVDANSYIQIAGGNFNPIQYNQASPQHAWLYQYNNTYPTPGVIPNGEVLFNSSNHKLFYFDLNIFQAYSSVFTGTGSNNVSYKLFDIQSIGQAWGAYQWKDVTGIIKTASPLPTIYFFDFKNWKYWKIAKSTSLVSGIDDWIGGQPKSLDRFLKWPEGWGKQ
jgi:hypothetical protein